MKSKGKGIKRIAQWLLCLAVVLAAVNLPAFKKEAKAAAAPATPLTFTAEEADSTVKFEWVDGSDVQYSTNDGFSWSDYTAGTAITLTNVGDKVSFKGNSVTTDSSNHFTMTGKIAASGDVTSLTNGSGGDVTLTEACYSYMFSKCSNLTSAPALPSTTLAEDCYSNMFSYCSSLTSAPALPATTLANYCYYGMFLSCTSLTSAPELKATTLAKYCYAQMFTGCSKLKVGEVEADGSWVIPGDSLPSGWNLEMVYGTAAGSVTKIQAGKQYRTDIAFVAYDLNGGAWENEYTAPHCYVVGTGLTLPTAENISRAADDFEGWYDNSAFTGSAITSIATTERDDITYYAKWKHDHDFSVDGCVSTCRDCGFEKINHNISEDGICTECGVLKPNYLTFTVEEARSSVSFKWVSGSDVMYSTDGGSGWNVYNEGTKITLANVGDKVSFKGSNIKTNIDYHFTMTGKIAASGDVTSLTNGIGGDIVLTEACYFNMFRGCTSLTSAPALPATTIALDCYYSMFLECTGLTSAPALPATTLANGCYGSMFAGCTGLTSAPELPATTLAVWCYYKMFSGCIGLTSAPELKATTLADSCYEYMFDGCSKLAIEETNGAGIWEFPDTISAADWNVDMISGIAAGSAPGVETGKKYKVVGTEVQSITYELNYGSWAEGYTAPNCYVVGTGRSLPTAEAISRAKSTFEGWYEDPEFSGSAVTSIDAVADCDKTYYAKWYHVEHEFAADAEAVKIDGNKHGKECSVCHEIVTENHNFLNETTGKHQAACVVCGTENPDKCGEKVYYIYYDAAKELVIYGEGAMYDRASMVYSKEECKKVTIEKGVTVIGEGSFVEAEFSSVIIPDSVTIIRSSAFAHCYNLSSVTLPDSVTRIEAGAFVTSGIHDITISASVTSIAIGAFTNCLSLERFDVDEGNAYYSSEDGVLFDKNKKTLLRYPIGKKGKEYRLPDSVTSIGEHAFSQVHNLVSVMIPNSVISIGECAFFSESRLAHVIFDTGSQLESIGEAAFTNCSALKEITIPKSVTSVGLNIFLYCDALKDIYAPCCLLSSVDIWKNRCEATVTYTHDYARVDSQYHKCIRTECDSSDEHSFTDGICECGYHESCSRGEHNFADPAHPGVCVCGVVETISVSGSISWEDADNQDGKRPASVTVNLLADGSVVRSITVGEADSWSFTFTDVAKYAEGTLIAYTVTEDTIDDYMAAIDDYAITNEHTPEVLTVSGSVIWEDDGDRDGKRPESVTVNLLADGIVVESITVSEMDSWNIEFADVTKYSDGWQIVYTIMAEEADGYDLDIDAYDLTFAHETEKITIEGIVVWEDNDDTDQSRPESLSVKLLENGETVDTVIAKADSSGSWEWKFTSVNKYSGGMEATYTIATEEIHCYDTAIEGTTITNTLNHKYVIEDTSNAEALISGATCTEPAKYHKVCYCGIVSTSAEDVFEGSTALGHSFSKGAVQTKCDRCDFTREATMNVENLTVTAGLTEAVLTWSPVPQAVKYAVYKKSAAGVTTLLASDVTKNSYIVNGLTAGEKVGFIVRPYADGWGNYSQVTWVTMQIPTSVIPEGLTAVPSENGASVSWSAVSGAREYALYQKNADGTTVLVSDGITGTSYEVTGLTAGARAGFIVRAKIGTTWYGYSTVTWTTLPAPAVPPTGVKAQGGDGCATVTWNAVPGAGRYALYQKSAAGAVTLISAEVTGTSYEVTGLTNGETVGFVLKSRTSKGWSTWSATGWTKPQGGR